MLPNPAASLGITEMLFDSLCTWSGARPVNLYRSGSPYFWVKNLTWTVGWPVFAQ